MEVTRLKLIYGSDSQGFYWPGSKAKRSEILGVKRNAPSTFESVYQGRPGKRIGRIFKREDFAYFAAPPNLEEGIIDLPTRELCQSAHMILQCWDTAFSSTEQSAHSVCVTAAIHPCEQYHNGENVDIFGPCETHFDVSILHVRREQLDWGGLINGVKESYYRWLPHKVLIENRASGISLVQTLPVAGIPIEGVSTGSSSKGARAINQVDEKAAGSVQGWYRQHRVRHAENAPWLNEFETELIDFSGGEDSSADQVDALVHLVTRVILMSVGTLLFPTNFGKPEANLPQVTKEEMEDAVAATDPRAAFLQYLGTVMSADEDPYAGTCGRCTFNEGGFCKVQKRGVIMLDGCEFYAPKDGGPSWAML